MKNLSILNKLPKILAHRGACTLAPENTLEAFETALKYGCKGTELDVHMCKTGELVISHDHWLDRVAGVHKKIEETSYEEIKELNMSVGYNEGKIPVVSKENYTDGFSKGEFKIFANTKMPTLDEVLELVGRDFFLDIELKSERFKNKELVFKLAQTLDKHKHSKCIVSSFNPFIVNEYKKLKRETAAVIYSSDKTLPWFLRHKEAVFLTNAPIKKPSIEIVRKSKNLELGKKPIIVWTVDSKDEASYLLESGVKCVITNRIQDFSF